MCNPGVITQSTTTVDIGHCFARNTYIPGVPVLYDVLLRPLKGKESVFYTNLSFDRFLKTNTGSGNCLY